MVEIFTLSLYRQMSSNSSDPLLAPFLKTSFKVKYLFRRVVAAVWEAEMERYFEPISLKAA